MDKKKPQTNKNIHKSSRCSGKYLVTNDNIVEKPLSPILNKSKYSRKVMIDKRQNKRAIKKELDKKAELLDESESKCCEKRSSSIPIPVKDSNQLEFKKPLQPVTKQSKPCKILSELIEFKNEIINNCAKSSNIPTYKTKFQTGSGKSISISESKIKKYSDIFADILKTKNKTESDLKELKVKQRNDLKPETKLPKPHNIEFKCASGDITDEPMEFDDEGSKDHLEKAYKSGTNIQNVDMLYENDRFDTVHISKTTVGFGSFESLQVIDEVAENAEAVRVFANKNYSYLTDSSKDSVEKGITLTQEIERTGITDSQLSHIARKVEKSECEPYFNDFFGDNISQLDYNISPGESNYVLKQSRHTLEKILDRKDRTTKKKQEDTYQMSTQEDTYFCNLTQNINSELEKQTEGKRNLGKKIDVTIRKSNCNEGDFAGFSQHEYEKSVREYKKHKSIIKNYNKYRKEGFAGFSESELKTIVNEYEKYKIQIQEMEKELKNEKIYEKKTKHRKETCKSRKSKKDSDDLKNLDCRKQSKLIRSPSNSNKNPHDLDYHLPVSKRLKYNSKASLGGSPEGHSIPRIYTPRSPLFCSGKKLKLFARTLTQKVNSGRTDDEESVKAQQHLELLNSEDTNAYEPEKSMIRIENIAAEKHDCKEIAQYSNCAGFSTASGKSIKISRKCMKDATTMFSDEIQMPTVDETRYGNLKPQNRVQICIGNNKIRINIKSNDADSSKHTKERLEDLDDKDNYSIGKESDVCKESEYLKDDFIEENHFGNSIGNFKDNDISSKLNVRVENSLNFPMNRKILKPKSAIGSCRPSSKQSSIAIDNSHMFPENDVKKRRAFIGYSGYQPIFAKSSSNIFEFGKSKENINFVFNPSEIITSGEAEPSEKLVNPCQSTSKSIDLYQDIPNYRPETITCYQMSQNQLNDNFHITIDQNKFQFNKYPIYDLVNHSVASNRQEENSNQIGEGYYAPFAVSDNYIRETEPKFSDLNTVTELKIPDTIINDLKNIFEIMDDSTSGYNSSVNKSNTLNQTSFSSFSKVSGKMLVSSRAMEKTKNMLEVDEAGDDFKGADRHTELQLNSNSLNKNNSETVDSPSKLDFFKYNLQQGGFTKASGKNIFISNEAIIKAKQLFDNDDYNMEPNEHFEAAQTIGLCAKNSIDSLEKGDNAPAKQISFSGFSKASGKNIEISDEAFERAQNMFESNELNFKKPIFTDLKKCSVPTGFTKASGKLIDISKAAMNKANQLFDEIENENIYNFEKPEGMFLNIITNENVKPIEGGNKLDLDIGKVSKTAHELIEDVVNTVDSALEKCHSTKKTAHEPIQNSIEELINNDHSVISAESFELSSSISNRSPTYKRSNNKINLISRPCAARSRRRLGISGLKQINIPQEKIDKAKNLFEENDDVQINPLLTPNKNTLRIFNSTPIKVTPTKLETSAHASTPLVNRKFENLHFDVTPIKQNVTINSNFVQSPIVFQEKSCMDFKRLQENLDSEYTTLRKRLLVIEERKAVLEKQINVIENGGGLHKRQKIGILMQNKRSCIERVPLEKLFNSGEDSLNYFTVAQYIFDITPKNSGQVHFSVESSITVLTTLDDGVIIPNSQNVVGVTEFANALKAMPGVDPKLIPAGWVQNHYKWIIWKLASYERKFPQYFNGSLSIENVMQQLKYRYDREIDKAERSAVRRILEKDDVSQKRLVVCVSDIIQIYNNKFEIELTDGWYAVRTSIDAALTQQIYTSKIKIGTKLIVQGADLLNCDGCHPLDVPDNVRLKISFNSSRRAAWHLKLGYYKYPHPFPIKLSSVHPDGGLIGCLKIYIARVYPIRYMENFNNVKVWRNAKAEDKRCREFEAERIKQMEAVKYKVLREFENEVQEVAKNKGKKLDFSKIACPKTLYNIVEGSNDPDKIMGILSSSQKNSIFDYKQNAGMIRQQEISSRITQEIEALNLNKRTTTPMLKLLIMDAIDKNEKASVFNIWRPVDEHLQILKEETALTVYNVSIKKTGDLQSTNKTYFKLDNIPNQIRKTQRQLLPIAMTVDCYYKPLFNEFDTVGLIVQITINNYDQDLWLSDFVGRLLFVKITDGANICSLLDNVKRGQTIALSNLVLHNPQNGFGQAIANQYTVISQYPHHKYLQNGLELFTQQLPEDTGKLLSICDDNIEKFRIEVDFRSNYSYRNHSLLQQIPSCNDVFGDSSEDNSSIIPSRLTMTDVAMSLIDTDQFL